MWLEVLRFSSGEHSTLGMLFDITNERKFLCFTLEDEKRLNKVMGETRVPAGTYPIGLRKEGGFHTKYSQKFGVWHRGMLHIQDIPNYEFILIHIGNTDSDTAGCLLVGNTSEQNITKNGLIGDSTVAYQRIYTPIVDSILSGEICRITYVDYDRNVVE